MNRSEKQYAEFIEREVKRAFPRDTALVGDEIFSLIVHGNHRGLDAGPWLEVADRLFRAAEFTLLVINVVLHAKKTQSTHQPEGIDELSQRLDDAKKRFPDLPSRELDGIIASVTSDPDLNRLDGGHDG